jgi:hypothetical protein
VVVTDKAKSWPREHITWATLSAFGNSPIVKLVALAPLAAAVVRLDADFEFLEPYVAEAAWLYWSLMAVAMGQFLYALFCPREVKRHGSNREQYIIEALTSMPSIRMRELRGGYIKALYQEGGLKPLISLQEEAAQERLQQRLLLNLQVPHGTVPALVQTYNNHFHVLAGRKGASENVQPVDVIRLAQLDEELVFGPRPNKLAHATVSRVHEILSQATEITELGARDWKVNVLDWYFRAQNGRNSPLIALIGILYIVGSGYFAWRTLKTIAFMLGLPFP